MTGIDRIQPTLFTMQVALAATMRSYGVRPGAVIGHSMGEAAAAVVAGALSLEDGVRVICRRSRLMSRIAGSGAMASVELPAQQVLSELMARGVNDVVVAVVASPQSTVIGGATQTVRDLVAAWEQRDVMAREIAVDVASHSPQVDPILDELTDVLAELDPTTPEVPFYSATLYDPRERAGVRCRVLGGQPASHGAVRRGGAGGSGGRLPGLRGAGAAPAAHPRCRADRPQSRHAAGRSGRHAPRTSAAIRAARLRGGSAQCGRRGGLLRALPERAAGGRAAADLDSPSADVDAATVRNPRHMAVAPFRCIRCWARMCACRRNRSATSGRPRSAPPPSPGWAITGSADVAVLPGAAYCEMALAAARTVLGEASEVRDIRFEQALLLDEQTTVGASASVSSPGVVDFAVETDQGGEHSAASHRSPACRTRRAATGAGHVRAAGGAPAAARTAPRCASAWTSVVFSTVRRSPVSPPCTPAEGATGTVLAEVALPGQIRSQQDAYGVHPALLDACFQSVAAHPEVQALGEDLLALPLGMRRLRVLRCCPQRPLLLHTGDEGQCVRGAKPTSTCSTSTGRSCSPCRGCELGTGASESGQRDRVLAKRLLTIEWQATRIARGGRADAGAWLLISTSTARSSWPQR